MRDGLMTIALNSGRPKDKYCVLSFTLYYGSLHTRADVFLYFHDIINVVPFAGGNKAKTLMNFRKYFIKL
jgi:hypothetical protein